MDSGLGALPDDIEALKAALVAESARAAHAEAELAVARAKTSDDQARGGGRLTSASSLRSWELRTCLSYDRDRRPRAQLGMRPRVRRLPLVPSHSDYDSLVLGSRKEAGSG
jgi:hypothetical protein